MLPDRAKIYVAAIEDAQYKLSKTAFWDDVYGVDMSCMAATFVNEPLIDVCNGDMIISNECKILDLNLCTMNKGDVEFTSEYEVVFNCNDRCHALVTWFDNDFKDLHNPITLTTSPYCTPTHWK